MIIVANQPARPARHSSSRGCPSATIMIDAHSNAALEPFLLMAKSMKGGAAIKVIEDAIGAVGNFLGHWLNN